jgi:hypothetical protein
METRRGKKKVQTGPRLQMIIRSSIPICQSAAPHSAAACARRLSDQCRGRQSTAGSVPTAGSDCQRRRRQTRTRTRRTRTMLQRWQRRGPSRQRPTATRHWSRPLTLYSWPAERPRQSVPRRIDRGASERRNRACFRQRRCDSAEARDGDAWRAADWHARDSPPPAWRGESEFDAIHEMRNIKHRVHDLTQTRESREKKDTKELQISTSTPGSGSAQKAREKRPCELSCRRH